MEPPMIIELCDIRIHPGQNAAFEEAIQRGIATVAARAKGFQRCKVSRSLGSRPRGRRERSSELADRVHRILRAPEKRMSPERVWLATVVLLAAVFAGARCWPAVRNW